MPFSLDELIAERGIRPRILIVDDQPLNIHIIHDIFKSSFDMFMATSGEQALRQCHEIQPDLILLDIVMNGMDGHEVCRRLHADPVLRRIPVIFLTSRLNDEDEAAGLLMGAVDFIRKPINRAVVRARVSTQLALKLQADKLRSLSLIDGLTGVANRRRFDEALQADWLLCARNKQLLSLLIIDVDHFKLYNDKYGHQQGDTCLKSVAATLRNAAKRPGDLLARFGGEEFACLLPDAGSSGAAAVARQMCEGVRGLKLTHGGSALDAVTVSIGYASVMPGNTKEAADLVAAADAKLYQAKQDGRAQACGMLLD